MRQPRLCLTCQKPFTPLTARHFFCSGSCRDRDAQLQRQLHPPRPYIDGRCAQCNGELPTPLKQFPGTRRKYCSEHCRRASFCARMKVPRRQRVADVHPFVLRYNAGLTSAEVAHEAGVTRQRTHQVIGIARVRNETRDCALVKAIEEFVAGRSAAAG